mmetsp:Transcript_24071/g.44993  ORF Transcript_24071/g.44993 Transcript_24071/m.44993 type:complete len:140 (-) Transcript_24071:73-492(-)
MAEKKAPEAVIIMGDWCDNWWAKKIVQHLDVLKITSKSYAASAHKQPLEVLKVLETYASVKNVVYITIAGLSNALSGFVAANSTHVTIACPPFKDNADMMVNIHSTLQMPPKAPVLTVLNPENCALCCKRILDLATTSG